MHWDQETFLSAGKTKDWESHPFVYTGLFLWALGFYLLNFHTSSQGKSKDSKGYGKGGGKLLSNVIAQNSKLVAKIFHFPRDIGTWDTNIRKPLCVEWHLSRVMSGCPSVPSLLPATSLTHHLGVKRKANCPNATALGNAWSSFPRQPSLPAGSSCASRRLPLAVSAVASDAAGALTSFVTTFLVYCWPLSISFQWNYSSSYERLNKISDESRWVCLGQCTHLYRGFHFFGKRWNQRGMNQVQFIFLNPICQEAAGPHLCQDWGKEAAQAAEVAGHFKRCFPWCLNTQKISKGKMKWNHCNSGGKWCFNSYQASYPTQVCLCYVWLLPCCWRQERQLTLQWATKTMQEVLTRQKARHQVRTHNERHHHIILSHRDLVQTCLQDDYL